MVLLFGEKVCSFSLLLLLNYCIFITIEQIFVQSFVASQTSKDKHWLAQSAKDADLEVDEQMYAEAVGASTAQAEGEEEGDVHEQQAQQEAKARKAILAAKAQLQALLDAPVLDANTHTANTKKRARTERRGGKAGVVDSVSGENNSWKKRNSFFVFAK